MGELTVVALTDDRGVTITARSDEWDGERLGLVDMSGWYGGVSVRQELPARLGHGLYGGMLRDGGRHLTLVVEHDADAPVGHALNRMLSGLGRQGVESDLTVSTPDGLTLACRVRLEDSPTPDHVTQRLTRWTLPLVAPDPCLYGPAQSVRVSTPAADYGLDWPLFANGDVLTWGSGADLTVSGWIVNAGNAAAWPVVTVYGDFPSGVSVGDGSGRTVTFAGIVTPQAPLVLDFAAHTATVGGEDRSHMLTGRGFFQAPPGGVLRPVLRAAGVGSGYADVQVRSTYM